MSSDTWMRGLGLAEDQPVADHEEDADQAGDHRDLAGRPVERVPAGDDPREDERREAQQQQQPVDDPEDLERVGAGVRARCARSRSPSPGSSRSRTRAGRARRRAARPTPCRRPRATRAARSRDMRPAARPVRAPGCSWANRTPGWRCAASAASQAGSGAGRIRACGLMLRSATTPGDRDDGGRPHRRDDQAVPRRRRRRAGGDAQPAALRRCRRTRLVRGLRRPRAAVPRGRGRDDPVRRGLLDGARRRRRGALGRGPRRALPEPDGIPRDVADPEYQEITHLRTAGLEAAVLQATVPWSGY